MTVLGIVVVLFLFAYLVTTYTLFGGGGNYGMKKKDYFSNDSLDGFDDSV